MSQLSARAAQILAALAAEYIDIGEPVGSARLTRGRAGVSSATMEHLGRGSWLPAATPYVCRPHPRRGTGSMSISSWPPPDRSQRRRQRHSSPRRWHTCVAGTTTSRWCCRGHRLVLRADDVDSISESSVPLVPRRSVVVVTDA
jgi:hypothetical protein